MAYIGTRCPFCGAFVDVEVSGRELRDMTREQCAMRINVAIDLHFAAHAEGIIKALENARG